MQLLNSFIVLIEILLVNNYLFYFHVKILKLAKFDVDNFTQYNKKKQLVLRMTENLKLVKKNGKIVVDNI